jgi:ATP-binding cassette, subfamily C (CFTR/MRP), member 1
MSLVLILVGVSVKTRSQSGLIGAALVNLMSFNLMIKQIVLLWTTLETSLGAVARVKSFSEGTVNENLQGENRVLDRKWPGEGAIGFKDVSPSYE